MNLRNCPTVMAECLAWKVVTKGHIYPEELNASYELDFVAESVILYVVGVFRLRKTIIY